MASPRRTCIFQVLPNHVRVQRHPPQYILILIFFINGISRQFGSLSWEEGKAARNWDIIQLFCYFFVTICLSASRWHWEKPVVRIEASRTISARFGAVEWLRHKNNKSNTFGTKQNCGALLFSRAFWFVSFLSKSQNTNATISVSQLFLTGSSKNTWELVNLSDAGVTGRIFSLRRTIF